MSLPASELPDTAPPLDRSPGHVPADERAAERCPPQSPILPQFSSPPQSPTLPQFSSPPQSSPPPQSPLPPQSERYDVESHWNILPFYGFNDSESHLCTAPPSGQTSSQLGLSEVRVADREATSCSGGLHDGHIPLQTVQTHAGWPKQSSLNPGADDFVMRDVTLIYGGLLRPDLDQDWDSVQEAHAGGLRQGGGVDSRLWGYVHPQRVVQCGQVAQEAS